MVVHVYLWIIHAKQQVQFCISLAVHSQKLARGLKFLNLEVEGSDYPIAKTKALISCAVTMQLIRVLWFF